METAQLADKLTAWIREKVTAAGCPGAILGMSGGIDSSVVAVLCQRAFPENTLGLMLPCYSNPEDEAHARLVATRFGIPAQTVVLDSVYDSLLKLLPAPGSEATGKMAQANLKVRLRMTTLYYFANLKHYMVVGSSNRSELAVGYFTKYGDGGVDIMPLGILVKKEVRQLARHLGIPQVIIDKAPTAGLWPGQTDEGEMGITYDELDRYLTTGKAPSRVISRIEGLAAAADHKRSLPPLPELDE
jgi:NAD+ synthase